MLFGVGVICRVLYSIVSYLYVSCRESITSVGEERFIYSKQFKLFECHSDLYQSLYDFFAET